MASYGLKHNLTLSDSDIDDIRGFLAIPSVSADPAFAGSIRDGAEWLCALCARIGLEHIEVLETPGHPSVYADWLHAEGQPTVLLYGHFDVQPVVDPTVWTNDPFTPEFRDGRVYARGASDMKVQMLAALLATEDTLSERGSLPINLRVLIEGEEETLSPNLRWLVQRNRELLACDFAVSPDGQQPVDGALRIGVGGRGFCEVEVAVKSADGDVHSGTYGGAIQNSAKVLADLISNLYHPDGQIAVAGFYDQVIIPSDAERASYSGELERAAAGGAALGSFGDPSWTAWERTTMRPAMDVNGLLGGYTGQGMMTVIPAHAMAKLSCRLVPDQDPDTVRELVSSHLEEHAPPGARVSVTRGSAAVPAYRCPPDHPILLSAARVLRRMSDSEPVASLSGGTLPVQAFLLSELGAFTVTFGFSCDDDGAHGIDEFHRLENFLEGRAAYQQLYEELGTQE